MKNHYPTILILIFISNLVDAQGAWTQKSNFGGVERCDAISFSIGTKGYLGTGRNSISAAEYQDFWEYDPATDAWTQKADFGGGARHSSFGWSIGNKGFVGAGVNVNGPVFFKDFWEYDAVNNLWTQKTDFGGTSRYEAKGFVIGNYGYAGTGYDGGLTKDFWQYDPANDTWNQKTDFGGVARYEAAAFAIGVKGYLGTGESFGPLSDFWEYEPINDIWTQKANYGGTARWSDVGFSLGQKGYIGIGVSSIVGYENDIWEYDPVTDAWTQSINFANGLYKHDATSLTIGNFAYVGTGTNNTGNYNDFWEFNPNSPCLVAYYTFTGDASDSSSNGYNGIVNGATLTTDRFGNANSAYLFNGTSDYINFSQSPITTDVPFSIVAWIKADTTNTHLPVVSLGCNGNWTLNELCFGTYDNNHLTVQTAGANDITSANAIPSAFQWVQVAVVHTMSGFNAGNFRFFINGVPFANNTQGGTNIPFPLNNVMDIGRQFGGGAVNFFKGKIDDVGIYDCALSDSEISVLYGNYNSGIDEKSFRNNFVVFPVPATTELTFEFKEVTGAINATIAISNQLGEIKKKVKVITDSQNRMVIPVDELSNGIYLLQLTSGKETVSKKIAIIK